jgi:hypothetical protein
MPFIISNSRINGNLINVILNFLPSRQAGIQDLINRGSNNTINLLLGIT